MSSFVKAARFVGDLDDDFYADELQRDIWNEASAVGFQSFLWIGLIASSVLPFAAGITGAWIGLGIYLALTVVSFVVLGYARARGIDMYSAQELRRVRIALASVLMVVSGGGALIRLLAHYAGGDLGNTWIGVAIGASLGFAAAIVGVKMHQRRKRDAEHAAEEAELRGFETND
ncbi:MAG: hypothetical protein ACOH2Q_12360 [Rhodococcus sp. (in: high G+C Gram-positive bacteria)]